LPKTYVFQIKNWCFGIEQPLDKVIYEFKRNGLLFESTKQLNILMPLLADVYNNTRTWTNRGYNKKRKLSPGL